VGGYGSGRYAEKYVGIVEECCSLGINAILRRKWIAPGRRTSGIIKWHTEGKEFASIGYEGRMDIWPPHLRLYYTCNRTDRIDYKVHLVTIRPNFGGTRYWFLCPSCGKRIGKLYFASTQRYFTCRICQGLTYRSCRESHDFDAIIAKIRQPGQSRGEALLS
jgi:hypothetical protein